MVIRPNRKLSQRGWLMAELLVAIAIFLVALMPIAYSFTAERKVARADYDRAVAMEIVDGEMEVLVAGEWRAFPVGTHPYAVNAQARTNLPDGQFTLTVESNKVRLEWQPAVKGHGGPVVREVTLR